MPQLSEAEIQKVEAAKKKTKGKAPAQPSAQPSAVKNTRQKQKAKDSTGGTAPKLPLAKKAKKACLVGRFPRKSTGGKGAGKGKGKGKHPAGHIPESGEKMRRYHPGSKFDTACISNHLSNHTSPAAALREIKRYQKSWDLLIPKLPFQRVVREIAHHGREPGDDALKFQSPAVGALQEAAESFFD